MTLEQYKDANRAELWEILQIQLEETQRLTAERDELLSLIYNTALGELTMSYRVDIESMASVAYSITGINSEELTKQAEGLTND